MSGGLRLDEIVARLGGELHGDGSLLVSQVGSLLSAGEGQIAFLVSPKYREQLQRTRATAVIVPPQFAEIFAIVRDCFVRFVFNNNAGGCWTWVAASAAVSVEGKCGHIIRVCVNQQ